MTGETVQPNIMVHPSYFGRIEEFMPGSDWKNYVEQLEMFFEVNCADRQACTEHTYLDG